jgi:hypothetical protein
MGAAVGDGADVLSDVTGIRGGTACLAEQTLRLLLLHY